MPQKSKKLLKAKRNRYRVDTYVEDGVYNDRFTVTSYHNSLREARAEAIKEAAYQRKMSDHGMVHIDSAISSQNKKFKFKKSGKKDKLMSKKNNKNSRNVNADYRRGKKWGFAVMTAATKTSKGAVMKADKAMQTCANNARTGCKRLSASERAAYRGIADGMYDAFRKSERRR